MLKRPKSNLTKLSNILDIVKENLGINKNLKITALREIWPLITSFEIAKNSQPAYFDKHGNLVINVKSSTLATDLSMQKTTLEARLKEATKNTDICFKQIRFVTRTTKR